MVPRRYRGVRLSWVCSAWLVACTQQGQVGQRADAAVPDAGALQNAEGVADARAAADAGLAPDATPRRDAQVESDAGAFDASEPEPDSGARTCLDACEVAVACFGEDVRAECFEACGNPEVAGLILGCDAGRAGCEYPEECLRGLSSPRETCRENCDKLAFFRCVSPASVARCVEACGTASPLTLDQFNTCSVGICEGDACFRVLVPDGGGADVESCRASCDRLVRFDCINAFEQSDCRSLCGRASREAAETFDACSSRVCDGPSCYLVFRGSVP